jgi:hypothetical protein
VTLDDTGSPSGLDEDGADRAEPSGGLARLLRTRDRLASVSPARQRWLLAAAGVLFVVAAVAAAVNLPDDVDRDPDWLALAVVGVAGPLLTIVCNGGEFVVQGRLLGRRLHLGEAVRVSVLGTAANLLPLPGSILVRTQALAGRDGYRRAAASTMVAAVAWIGATAALGAALTAFVDGAEALTATLAAAAAVLFVTTGMLVARLRPPSERLAVFGALLGVEAATAAVGAARFYLTIRFLGLDATAAQAIALTMSGVLASATGIFPAGIGIREAIAGAISPLVGLSASVGVVAAAVDRVFGLAVLAVVTATLVVHRNRAGVSAREMSR